VVDAAPALETQPLVPGLSYAFSLHATKPFGIGEGCVLLDIRDNADSLTLRTNFGFFDGDIACQGGNYKVSEYHCAVGLAQLARLQKIRKPREAIYQDYQQLFEDPGLLLQQQQNENGLIPSNLMVSVEGLTAKSLSEDLWANDIICRRQFWPLLCDHSFAFSNQQREEFPVAVELSEKLICLPFHNFLSRKEMEAVVDQLLKLTAAAKNIPALQNNGQPFIQQ
jgi:dTDP-4-amino-4,6-dideoxygalactose transaminase